MDRRIKSGDDDSVCCGVSAFVVVVPGPDPGIHSIAAAA